MIQSQHREISTHHSKRSCRGRNDFRGKAHSLHDVVYDDDNDEYDDEDSVFSYSDADDGHCEHDDCDDYDNHTLNAHTSIYTSNNTQPTLLSESSTA